MNIFWRILGDAAIMAAIGGIVAVLVRKWVTAAVDHRFAAALEEKKAGIEHGKTKDSHVLAMRQSVMPDLVTLVYRLRNTFRENLDKAQSYAGEPRSGPDRFGEDLYLLTLKLYQSRIFIPEDLFQKAHKFKRCLQEADVEFDRASRYEIMQFLRVNDLDTRMKAQAEWDRFVSRWTELFDEVDKLYPEMTVLAKSYIEGPKTYEDQK